jgi:metallo-beta-lactamase class B
VLKSLHCDIFLGAHGAYYGLQAKYARLKQGDQTAYIDPNGYRQFVTDREAAFRKELERQKKEQAK